jgi:cation diffusion facilitator family transporter
MNATIPTDQGEKRRVARSSLAAAVALMGLKLAAGLLTGSLGLLADAAHSGLDLVASTMTFLAIRISARPADSEHLYGHGKVENLSALAETALLLVTCLWIVHEAVRRLWFHVGGVEASWWAFLVMVASIAVNASRWRALHRTAKKYNSQALEADALHFRADMWSSSVVIAGLGAVRAADWAPGLAWLRAGDAVAALGVSAVVVWVSLQLGRRTVDALVDTAPKGLERRIAQAVEAIAGVRDCHNVRIRPSGPRLFIDLHVLVDGGQTLAHAHGLTEEIEAAILKLAPGADVTVHPEPF